jgi:hypothetical protein
LPALMLGAALLAVTFALCSGVESSEAFAYCVGLWQPKVVVCCRSAPARAASYSRT